MCFAMSSRQVTHMSCQQTVETPDFRESKASESILLRMRLFSSLSPSVMTKGKTESPHHERQTLVTHLQTPISHRMWISLSIGKYIHTYFQIKWNCVPEPGILSRTSNLCGFRKCEWRIGLSVREKGGWKENEKEIRSWKSDPSLFLSPYSFTWVNSCYCLLLNALMPIIPFGFWLIPPSLPLIHKRFAAQDFLSWSVISLISWTANSDDNSLPWLLITIEQEKRERGRERSDAHEV